MKPIRKYPNKVDGSESMRARSIQNTADRHRTGSGLTIEHAKKPENFRVKQLKSEAGKKSRKADGQYTRLTSSCSKHEFFTYRDRPDRIYRRDKTKSDRPICVLEKINGEWFPTAALTDSEINSLRPFTGSALIDPDRALEKKRLIKKLGSAKQLHPTDAKKIEKHRSASLAHGVKRPPKVRIH